uniref:Uncharacterized protein n=1 Tax=Brassica oleracea var. oleracea TaxID=109376 RepID=A0A0D3A2Q3_BRAOL
MFSSSGLHVLHLMNSPQEKRNVCTAEQRVQKEETGIIKRKVKSALDTLANAAITTTVEQRDTEVAASTKHPRHRAGCSCIVCSQPPSGKGKHKPSCTCTVCEAVKRRFKTLMLRKRNREEAGQASQQALSR